MLTQRFVFVKNVGEVVNVGTVYFYKAMVGKMGENE